MVVLRLSHFSRGCVGAKRAASRGTLSPNPDTYSCLTTCTHAHSTTESDITIPLKSNTQHDNKHQHKGAQCKELHSLCRILCHQDICHKRQQSTDLSENEGCHICGLPEAGVEQVGKRHRGEGLQALGAVQCEIHALTAPPLVAHCNHHTHTLPWQHTGSVTKVTHTLNHHGN